MWHRGLWFTWKFVNGANYWEEGQEPQGNQITVRAPEVTTDRFGESITISTELEWRDRGQTTLHERRRIVYRPGKEAHFLDWEIEQAAEQAVVLDRTVYTTWGGYGGLVVRAPQPLRGQNLLLPSGETTDYIAGVPHRWCDLSGQMDGGPDRYGGITFLDHPGNQRHPSPVYARTRPLDNFMNLALLFHEPLTLEKGDTLHLRYRVILHDGRGDADALNAAWEEYAAGRI